MAKLLLDCQAVSRLLSEGQDLTLPGPDRARMRLHLVMCQSCRNASEQLAFIRLAMQRLGREEPDPPPREGGPDPSRPR